MTRTARVVGNVLDAVTNHLIKECPNPPKEKNQRAFVRDSGSDSDEEDDEKAKDETCLGSQASNEAYNGGNVIFGSNLRGNIIGKGKICDNKCKVTFSEHDSEITNDGKVIGRGIRKKGLYVMKLGNKPKDKIGLSTIDENSTLWHRRLGHANMYLIQSLSFKELVINLPKLKCLELPRMDLFGPSAVWSYRGNLNTLVIVDDYSRTDHGREFDNEVQFGEFCNANGITHNFLALRTPQSKDVVTEKKNIEKDIEDETLEIDDVVNIKESRNHPLENLIGNLNQRTLRSQAQNQSNFFYFISTIDPKNVNEALKDESWIIAMQEELNKFVANDVWELVPQPKNMTIIGTKWVYRNKLDNNSVVSRNKARLESIRILLAYAHALDFKLLQMDVKSAFLNGFNNGEVYVAQPSRFIDFDKPDHVYKLKKALYGLKQAPKSWYDRLKAFLIKHEYNMEMVDNTLFIKKKSSNLIIVQIYVDDIIFGLTCQDMCDEFAKIMHGEFEMKMLKKFGLDDSKPMKTPMSSDTKLTKDEELSAFVHTSKRIPKPLILKWLSVSSDTLKALRT
ncbi:retrovirus-related pol polyprotein from transposon TNT 1-94 [Tanacetum coccineum]